MVLFFGSCRTDRLIEHCIIIIIMIRSVRQDDDDNDDDDDDDDDEVMLNAIRCQLTY